MCRPLFQICAVLARKKQAFEKGRPRSFMCNFCLKTNNDFMSPSSFPSPSIILPCCQPFIGQHCHKRLVILLTKVSLICSIGLALNAEYPHLLLLRHLHRYWMVLRGAAQTILAKCKSDLQKCSKENYEAQFHRDSEKFPHRTEYCWVTALRTVAVRLGSLPK